MFLVKKVTLSTFDSELDITFAVALPKYSDLTLKKDGFSSLQKASGKVVQIEFGFNA